MGLHSPRTPAGPQQRAEEFPVLPLPSPPLGRLPLTFPLQPTRSLRQQSPSRPKYGALNPQAPLCPRSPTLLPTLASLTPTPTKGPCLLRRGVGFTIKLTP